MKNFIRLFLEYFKGSDKIFAILAGLGILALSGSTVGLSFLFNNWKIGFWNAIEQRDVVEFWWGMGEFSILAFAFILVVSYTRYFAQRYCLRWRKWLTSVYVDKWIKTDGTRKVENPDQRLQQDLLMFTQLTERLLTGFLNAFATLIVFTPILWAIASGIPVLFDTAIPGYFWIISFGWALVGIIASYFIGKKIPKLEYNNQKTEADFRYNLVKVRDGVKYSLKEVMNIFSPLYNNHVRLYRRFKYFSIWAVFHAQINIILPFLAAAPLFLTGAISLGILMQIAHAFGEVAKSLNYIFDHYLEICELSSVITRLHELKVSLK